MILDVSRRQIVVVGGGSVAARKVAGLVDAGAAPRKVRVVAPQCRAELPAGIELLAEEYRPQHLDGAQLVFAATDSPAVNDAVVRDAHERGALVCRADVDDDEPAARGDFITPAKLVRGPVTITVSAGGSPALAAAIRDELARQFDARWAMLAAAMQTLRPLIRQNPRLSPDQRRQIFRELAGADAMEVVAAGETELNHADGSQADRAATRVAEALVQWLRKRHPQFD
jgi:precorrin-2 dehydrogenase/sirohydrochlorin ferrochelatase